MSSLKRQLATLKQPNILQPATIGHRQILIQPEQVLIRLPTAVIPAWGKPVSRADGSKIPVPLPMSGDQEI